LKIENIREYSIVEIYDYFTVGSSAEVDDSTKDWLRLFLNK